MKDLKAWYDVDEAERGSAVASELAAVEGHRSRRSCSATAMAWAYDRDRWRSEALASGAAVVPEQAGKAFPWLRETGDWLTAAPPSANIIKDAVDTIVAWLFTDQPALDVQSAGAQFEERRRLRARSKALDATCNTRLASEAFRRAGRDGALKQLGWIRPYLEPTPDGLRVRFRRLLEHQIYYDPHAAREGEPESMHVVEIVDRRALAGWLEALAGEDGKDAVARLADVTPWSPTADDCSDTIYDWELDSAQVTESTDRVRVVHSVRLASAGGDPGRYTITAHGGRSPGNPSHHTAGAWDGAAVTLLDREYTRTGYPWAWWTPYPADEGLGGTSWGHLLTIWQEAIDRGMFKIQRALDRYGHIRIYMRKSATVDRERWLRSGIEIIDLEDWYDEPRVDSPSVIRAEDLAWIERLEAMARTRYGINQMMQQGASQLGAGASGVALYEEAERSEDRLSDVYERFQDFRVRVAEIVLDLIMDAVQHGDKLVAAHLTGDERLQRQDWGDLVKGDEEYTIRVAQTGPRSRMRDVAKLLDAAQRGLVDPDDARDALLGVPDMRRAAGLATADYRLVEAQLEELIDKDGDWAWATPDAECPLPLCVRLAERTIWAAREARADPDTVDRLRTYHRTAARLLADQTQPPAGPTPVGPGGQMTPPAAPGGQLQAPIMTPSGDI